LLALCVAGYLRALQGGKARPKRAEGYPALNSNASNVA